MKNRLSIIVLIIAIIVIVNCCRIPTGTDNPGDDIEMSEVLAGLGVDTDPGPLLDPNGNPIPESANPFGSNIATVVKQCEILVAGAGYNSRNFTLFEDLEDSGTPAVLYSETNDGWATGNPKKSVAADVDGDGYDEIVFSVFYFDTDQIGVRILDINNDVHIVRPNLTFSGDLEATLTGVAANSSTAADSYLRQDLAKGDLDGDSRDELIITVGRRFYVLDDSVGSYTVLASADVDDLDAGSDTYLRVDTGDFDNDSRAEIIFANGEGSADSVTARYIVYDDLIANASMNTPLDEGYLATTSGSTEYRLRAADLCVGDFDGDLLPEVAFGGMIRDDTAIWVMILDVTMDETSEPIFSLLETAVGDSNERGVLFYGMAAGDIDNNGRDEIAMYHDIFALTGGNLSTHPTYGNEYLENAYELPVGLFGSLPINDITELDPLYDAIAFGDVTGDLVDDLVYVTWNSESTVIIHRDNDGSGAMQRSVISVTDAPSRVTLALPNVDDDSTIVRYEGHDLVFSQPYIIAYLVSPPYWQGINNTGSGGTTFGSISGIEKSFEFSNGFTSSVSVGFSAEVTVPFFGSVAETSTKLKVSNAMSWAYKNSVSTTETWGYSTPVGEDKVVFTAVPYDLYLYTIISDADPDLIGESLVITVPRKMRIYHQDAEYYHSHNGDGYDVPASVAGHTLGDPTTYPTSSDRDDIRDFAIGGMYSSNSMTAGEGTGSSTIGMDTVSTDSWARQWEFSVELEVEVKVGVITGGVSGGFKHTSTAGGSVSEGVYFSGEVPAIPGDAYEDNPGLDFTWGMMLYPWPFDGQAPQPLFGPVNTFTVVGYWVDP